MKHAQGCYLDHWSAGRSLIWASPELALKSRRLLGAQGKPQESAAVGFYWFRSSAGLKLESWIVKTNWIVWPGRWPKTSRAL